MTFFSHIALHLHNALFGRIVVRQRHLVRARRILSAAVEEAGCPKGILSEDTCDVLVQEAYARAGQRSPDKDVRWCYFLPELIDIGKMSAQAINGSSIEDRRIKQILEFGRLI